MSTTNPIFIASGGDVGTTANPSSPTGAFETESAASRSVDRVKSIEAEANVATLFSCFVNLSNTILGSGLLGLPYGIARMFVNYLVSY